MQLGGGCVEWGPDFCGHRVSCTSKLEANTAVVLRCIVGERIRRFCLEPPKLLSDSTRQAFKETEYIRILTLVLKCSRICLKHASEGLSWKPRNSCFLLALERCLNSSRCHYLLFPLPRSFYRLRHASQIMARKWKARNDDNGLGRKDSCGYQIHLRSARNFENLTTSGA